jgi:hypothetical protein
MEAEERYAVIYHTELQWYYFLKMKGLTDKVNFWTSRKNTLKLQSGMPFFFKLSTQRIAGYGIFIEQKQQTIEEAWEDYGIRNGVGDIDDFLARTNRTLHKISPEKTIRITSLVLENIVFFKEPPDINKFGISPFQVVRYINSYTANSIIKSCK